MGSGVGSGVATGTAGVGAGIDSTTVWCVEAAPKASVAVPSLY